MKPVYSLLVAFAVAASAFAGEVSYSAKSSKSVAATAPAPLGCDCFAPGAAFGIYGAWINPDNEDDAFGGGLLGEYFFTENIGIQGSYSLLATDSEHHEYDAALIARFPIEDICLAPYVMGGVGYAANSEEAWNVFAGAGLELRIPDVNCLGIFADGAYHWSEDEDADFVLIRLGVKFPL